MNSEIQDYAKRVAEAVQEAAMSRVTCVHGPTLTGYDCAIDLDAIIATVEPPVMQHHAAPTCDGWWWARTPRGVWWAVYVRDLEVHPAVLAHGESDPYKLREFDAWVGPLLPPDTTEPASVLLCEKVPHEQRGGYLHAEDDDTPYYVDGLRYCGRCHHFLDEGESHRAAPAPDVQAVKLGNCGKCCPGPLYSQHERDAAVAREREECAKECERIVSGIGSATAAFPVRVCASQIRARSAKGV